MAEIRQVRLSLPALCREKTQSGQSLAISARTCRTWRCQIGPGHLERFALGTPQFRFDVCHSDGGNARSHCCWLLRAARFPPSQHPPFAAPLFRILGLLRMWCITASVPICARHGPLAPYPVAPTAILRACHALARRHLRHGICPSAASVWAIIISRTSADSTKSHASHDGAHKCEHHGRLATTVRCRPLNDRRALVRQRSVPFHCCASPRRCPLTNGPTVRKTKRPHATCWRTTLGCV